MFISGNADLRKIQLIKECNSEGDEGWKSGKVGK